MSLMIEELDAFGRLVEDEEFRLRHQRAGDGELLLLAAGEIPAPPKHVVQHRELRGRRGLCTEAGHARASSGKISRRCGT